MSSGNDEAFIQHEEDDVESQNERQEHPKQLKSLEITKSALKIFTSNTKFMFLMLLSILPFCVCMVLYETKLQSSIVYVSSTYLGKTKPFSPEIILLSSCCYSSLNDTIPNSTVNSQLLHNNNNNRYTKISSSDYYDDLKVINKRREFLSDVLQLSIFYLFLYPLLEFFSMVFTMKLVVKLYAAEKPSTVNEVLNQKVNFKGPFITYLCVHLLSTMILLGQVWIISNHILFTGKLMFFNLTDTVLNALSVIVHSIIFLGLLYKYVDWTAFWNMSMVISVVSEEHAGIEAFGMSDYYGKLCKKTGFQLMLGFFVLGNALRLPCLYAGLCNGSFVGVLITCGVMMVVSTGNLVKWISFMLYFYYCKEQTMAKKVDDQELGRNGKS